MKFLVYTAEPRDENATLSGFEEGADKDISREIKLLEDMGLERVLEHQTVNLLVDNIDYNEKSGIVIADIYKQTSPGKSLHQVADDGDGISIQEILSEDEDAFTQGTLGMKKVGQEVLLIVENKFGSYFDAACRGMNLIPHYSSETIQSIQESDTIGRTTLDFADDYDLTASLIKPPEDEDVREEEGFGNVNVANKIAALLNISRAHRMSLDIDREEWLESVEIFDQLIQAGIVTKVRIEDTKNGVVSLGKGGDRAIRKKIDTSGSDKGAVQEAFDELPQ